MRRWAAEAGDSPERRSALSGGRAGGHRRQQRAAMDAAVEAIGVFGGARGEGVRRKGNVGGGARKDYATGYGYGLAVGQ